MFRVPVLSRIAQLDQRTALPDQRLHSAEADVRPPRRKSGPSRRRRSSLLALRYSYSINSSALSRIDVGTSRPSALAVVILSTVSYFTDNCTGRSAGFSLLRMRST